MINEIRTYFKSVINEVDSDLKQHDEYFTSENIPDLNLEDTYFLQIGAFTSALINNNYVGSFEVMVELWKNGNNDVIERLDLAYCNAIEIMSNLQDQSRIDQTTFIKSVLGTSLTPEAVETNDNLGKFTLQFTVTTSYKSI